MPDAGASDATSCAAVVRRLPPATAVAMVNTAAAAAVEGIADNCERRWVLLRERRWVLLKIPRCDIDGVGEGK